MSTWKPTQVIIVFIFAYLTLFATPSYSATTQLTGTYRYSTESNFRYLQSSTLIDGHALLNDYGLGIGASMFDAKNGDKWNFEIIRPDSISPRTIWTVKFLDTYDGKSKCFIDFGMFTYTRTSCNSSGNASYTAAQETYCQMKGDWKLQVRYTPGDGSAEQVYIADTVPVVSSGAKVRLSLSKSVINPKVVTGNAPGMTPFDAGVTDLTASVTDSNCTNYPLSDRTITVTSTTVAHTGGHAHMEEQEGTGYFGDSSQTKSIDLVTDNNGKATTTYTAGRFGLEEQIKVQTDDLNGSTSESSRQLSINMKAAGVNLIQLNPSVSLIPAAVDSSDLDYETYQTPSAAALHPDGENVYGTPKLIQIIQQMAHDLRAHRREATGQDDVRLLSVNDMSLPNGGVFDLCADLTTCSGGGGHVSHEEGVDFDLNNYGGHPTGQFDTYNDLDWLVRKAHQIDPSCWKVHNIHIRCGNAIH